MMILRRRAANSSSLIILFFFPTTSPHCPSWFIADLEGRSPPAATVHSLHQRPPPRSSSRVRVLGLRASSHSASSSALARPLGGQTPRAGASAAAAAAPGGGGARARRARTASTRSQKGPTVATATASSGECAPVIVGPSDTMSSPGSFSPRTPHSRPAWMARTSGRRPSSSAAHSRARPSTALSGLGRHPGYAPGWATSLAPPRRATERMRARTSSSCVGSEDRVEHSTSRPPATLGEGLTEARLLEVSTRPSRSLDMASTPRGRSFSSATSRSVSSTVSAPPSPSSSLAPSRGRSVTRPAVSTRCAFSARLLA
mmetsp:Transcript_1762/g.3057  ORF Transcript_1762/g.3057 Transcript_1762/m.3057 type:complete len:315 (-) Transcript_1762:365-1309(-)